MRTIADVPLPHVVARFNARVTDRFVQPVARRSPGFAVVHHVGRRSGAPFTTPVNLFRLEAPDGDDGDEPDGSSDGWESAVVSLTYGPSADWVRNVVIGGGGVEDRAGRRPIVDAVVVGRDVAWPALPWFVRAALRLLRVHSFLRLSWARTALDG